MTDPIHDLLAYLTGFEEGGGSFQSKDLRDARPSASKPCVELWTTDDPSMFEAAMSFVPGLSLLPVPIRGRIGEKIRQIRRAGGLILFGDQHVGAFLVLLC